MAEYIWAPRYLSFFMSGGFHFFKVFIFSGLWFSLNLHRWSFCCLFICTVGANRGNRPSCRPMLRTGWISKKSCFFFLFSFCFFNRCSFSGSVSSFVIFLSSRFFSLSEKKELRLRQQVKIEQTVKRGTSVSSSS